MADHVPATVQDLFQMDNILDLLKSIPNCFIKGLRTVELGGCGLVAKWLGSLTCDQRVVGSNSDHRAAECNLGQVVYTCASITKQYNLVPANGW